MLFCYCCAIVVAADAAAAAAAAARSGAASQQNAAAEPQPPHVIWSTSGGGIRSMIANMGYAANFAAAGLITDNSTMFTGMSSASGGTWFMVQFFFSRPFFDAIVTSTPDSLATFVSNWIDAYQSTQSSSPASQLCKALYTLDEETDRFTNLQDFLYMCSFASDWALTVSNFLELTSTVYGDASLIDRLASGDNIITPLADAYLQIQMSIGASARSSDLSNITFFGPASGGGELYTTPLPLSWGTATTNDNGGDWFPKGVTNLSSITAPSSETFNINDYKMYDLFPAKDDASIYTPNLFNYESKENKMPIPFNGKPNVAQVAAASSAYGASLSAGIPTSLAQYVSALNCLVLAKIEERRFQ